MVENHETWVHSANKTGKSFIAAVTSVWWFCTRAAKVITSSARPYKPAQYRNRRAELYGELRKALDPTRRVREMLALPVHEWTRRQHCLSLPPDDGQLREELAVLPKSYDGDGRLRLPPNRGPAFWASAAGARPRFASCLAGVRPTAPTPWSSPGTPGKPAASGARQ